MSAGPDIYGDSTDDEELPVSEAAPRADGKFAELRDENEVSKAQEEAEAAGDSLNIIFNFDDGSQAQQEFKQGQDVAWVKNEIAKAKEVEYGTVTLLLDGKMLIDPMSLSDYPEIKGQQEIEIQVKIA